MIGIAPSFWQSVDMSGGADACWPWKGGISDKGYGRWGGVVDGQKRDRRAHVVAYYYARGRWPAPAEVVRHCCDNRRCCNPGHLVEGTQADNIADAVERGRQAKGRGHGMAKLTESCVAEIRKRLILGEPQRSIAKAFAVHSGTVQAIADGRTWKHVQ